MSEDSDATPRPSVVFDRDVFGARLRPNLYRWVYLTLFSAAAIWELLVPRYGPIATICLGVASILVVVLGVDRVTERLVLTMDGARATTLFRSREVTWDIVAAANVPSPLAPRQTLDAPLYGLFLIIPLVVLFQLFTEGSNLSVPFERDLLSAFGFGGAVLILIPVWVKILRVVGRGKSLEERTVRFLDRDGAVALSARVEFTVPECELFVERLASLNVPQTWTSGVPVVLVDPTPGQGSDHTATTLESA